MTASGTFGYGVEFMRFGDLAKLGGMVVKGLSLEPRARATPMPRIADTTPAGMLNAIGLQNMGARNFVEKAPEDPAHQGKRRGGQHLRPLGRGVRPTGRLPGRAGGHRRAGGQHLLPQRQFRRHPLRTGPGHGSPRSPAPSRTTRAANRRHRQADPQRHRHRRHGAGRGRRRGRRPVVHQHPLGHGPWTRAPDARALPTSSAASRARPSSPWPCAACGRSPAPSISPVIGIGGIAGAPKTSSNSSSAAQRPSRWGTSNFVRAPTSPSASWMNSKSSWTNSASSPGTTTAAACKCRLSAGGGRR